MFLIKIFGIFLINFGMIESGIEAKRFPDILNYKKIGHFEWNNGTNYYVSQYYLWESFPKNWLQASIECNKIGILLAAFETRTEQDYVLKALIQDESLDDSFIFIGSFKKQGNWYWSETNEIINYEVCWTPGQLNHLGEDGNCLKIHRHLGKPSLNDESCETSYGMFLCEEHESDNRYSNKIEESQKPKYQSFDMKDQSNKWCTENSGRGSHPHLIHIWFIIFVCKLSFHEIQRKN